MDPITKVALGVSAVPAALSAGSIGMTWGIAPPRGSVEVADERINNLESELEKQLDSFIKGVVKNSVEVLQQELQTLESEVKKIEEKLDSNLQDNTKNLKDGIEDVKTQLNNLISKGESNLNTQLGQIKTQLESSDSQLQTQLKDKSQNLKTNIDNLSSILTALVRNKIDELRRNRRKIFRELEKKITALERNRNPFFTKKCQVELKEVREDARSRTKPKSGQEQEKWELEEFLKLIHNQENTRRNVGYRGEIPISKEIATQLRADCFDAKGEKTFQVGKKFSFYYLIDKSNK